MKIREMMKYTKAQV